MNYIKDIVEKVLPVEIGEEFNVVLDNGEYSIHNPVKFSETDLVNNDGDVINNHIGCLITGYYTTEKIPFVPKVGEYYWTYTAGIILPITNEYSWCNNCYDKERKLLGIIFKTEQEAKDYLPTWEKRLEGEDC